MYDSGLGLGLESHSSPFLRDSDSDSRVRDSDSDSDSRVLDSDLDSDSRVEDSNTLSI